MEKNIEDKKKLLEQNLQQGEAKSKANIGNEQAENKEEQYQMKDMMFIKNFPVIKQEQIEEMIQSQYKLQNQMKVNESASDLDEIIDYNNYSEQEEQIMDNFQNNYNNLQNGKRIYIKRTAEKVRRWTREEALLYEKFIEMYADIMRDSSSKRNTKIFLLMSKFIGTKTPSQCRSHHQKFYRKVTNNQLDLSDNQSDQIKNKEIKQKKKKKKIQSDLKNMPITKIEHGIDNMLGQNIQFDMMNQFQQPNMMNFDILQNQNFPQQMYGYGTGEDDDIYNQGIFLQKMMNLQYQPNQMDLMNMQMNFDPMMMNMQNPQNAINSIQQKQFQQSQLQLQNLYQQQQQQNMQQQFPLLQYQMNQQLQNQEIQQNQLQLQQQYQGMFGYKEKLAENNQIQDPLFENNMNQDIKINGIQSLNVVNELQQEKPLNLQKSDQNQDQSQNTIQGGNQIQEDKISTHTGSKVDKIQKQDDQLLDEMNQITNQPDILQMQLLQQQNLYQQQQLYQMQQQQALAASLPFQQFNPFQQNIQQNQLNSQIKLENTTDISNSFQINNQPQFTLNPLIPPNVPNIQQDQQTNDEKNDLRKYLKNVISQVDQMESKLKYLISYIEQQSKATLQPSN